MFKKKVVVRKETTNKADKAGMQPEVEKCIRTSLRI